MLAKIAFVLHSRLIKHSKVAISCYIKNPAHITLGSRCKIHSNASLDAAHDGPIVIGDGVTLNRYAYVQGARNGVVIGSGSEINNFSLINGAGGVIIGENVLIGPHVQIISYRHHFADPTIAIKRQGYAYEKIVIEDDVWIGANAVVLAGVTIGKGSVVGAGSVVTRSCAPYSVLAGVPARVIRRRGETADTELARVASASISGES